MSDKTNVKKLKPGTFVLGGSVLRRTIHWISASVARLIEIFMRGVKRVKKGEILEYAESATGLLVEGHVKTAKSPKVDITKEGKVDKIETSKEADVCGTLGGECAETIKDLSCHLTVFGGGVVRGNLHVKSAVLYPGSLFSGKLTAENDIVVYGGATGQTELISNNGVVKVHPKADVGYVFYKGQWYHPLGEAAQVCEPVVPPVTKKPATPPPADRSFAPPPAKPAAKPVDREPEGTEVPMGTFESLTLVQCFEEGKELLAQIEVLENKLNVLMAGESKLSFVAREQALAQARQALAFGNVAKHAYKAVESSFDADSLKLALERLDNAVSMMQTTAEELEILLAKAGVSSTPKTSAPGLATSAIAEDGLTDEEVVANTISNKSLLLEWIKQYEAAGDFENALPLEIVAKIVQLQELGEEVRSFATTSFAHVARNAHAVNKEVLKGTTKSDFFKTKHYVDGLMKKASEIRKEILAWAVKNLSGDERSDLERKLDEAFGRSDGRAPATRQPQGDRHPQTNGPKARPEAKPAPKDAGSQNNPSPAPTPDRKREVTAPALSPSKA